MHQLQQQLRSWRQLQQRAAPPSLAEHVCHTSLWSIDFQPILQTVLLTTTPNLLLACQTQA